MPPLLGRILQLPPEEVERIAIDLERAAGFQPIQVTEYLDWERFAAVSVRLPKTPAATSGCNDHRSSSSPSPSPPGSRTTGSRP